jgi:hypothetical protein
MKSLKKYRVNRQTYGFGIALGLKMNLIGFVNLKIHF